MSSTISRFRNRKNVSREVEVRFVPTTVYVDYIQEVLQPDWKDLDYKDRIHVQDLSDEQREEAEARFDSLVFVFGRAAPAELRKWDIFVLSNSIYTAEYVEYVVDKLAARFKSAEHKPLDDSTPIEIKGEKGFKEFCDSCMTQEIVELSTAYRKALNDDASKSEGNLKDSEPDSKMQ
jgi:hypothetical protein